MVFPILLVVGLVGLAAMWAAGLSHSGARGHAHRGLGHKGHVRAIGRAPAHRAPLLRAPGARGAAAAATAMKGGDLARAEAPLAVAEHEDAKVAWVGRALALLSPITWCGLLIGAGAAGTLAGLLGAPLLVAWACAIGGAIAFQVGILGPVSRAVFQFASKPAANLDGCLFQEVSAVTRFNGRGEGLVRVTFDGRTEDVLATLTEEDKKKPGRVERGDRLVIEEVHLKSNRCRVSRSA